MEYHTLGRSGLRVSALALGTVELGLTYGIALPGESHQPSQAEGVRLVHAALEAGITLIDTARAYGVSEAVLGVALANRRQDVILATKVRTQRPDGTTPTGAALREAMLADLMASLHALRTDYVDLWQIHNVDAALLAERETVAAVFDEARRMGMVRAVGGSTYAVAAPLAALASDLFDVLQVTYSVLDQRLEERVFPAAAAQNVGLIVRSVLLKGVLTPRGDYLPDRLAPLRERSQAFRRVVAAHNAELSPVQAAITFVLGHPQVGATLVGVRNAAELAEAVGAADRPLPAELRAALKTLRLDDPELLDPSTWGIP
ncbi:MAG: aldo/keto reductase [Oscillochloris sp.]|nr:aldo/keto reductase [Oscillochloris sp.]